jgi:hypothetical protein
MLKGTRTYNEVNIFSFGCPMYFASPSLSLYKKRLRFAWRVVTLEKYQRSKARLDLCNLSGWMFSFIARRSCKLTH